MNFKRKAYDELLKWKKESNGKSAILIEGARRIGKSTLAVEFAKNEYENYVLIDFALEDDRIKKHMNNFDNLGNPDEFFRQLQYIEDKVLEKRKCVIIFDEVEKFPRARQAIKQLVMDGRYDYIETGSLISIKKNVKDILIPSEEDHLYMYPMDFEEYLWAVGKEVSFNYIRECYEKKVPLSEDIHKKILKDFRTYLIVGGMPQAVDAYVNGLTYQEIETIKNRIVSLYKEDISKNDDTNSYIKSSLVFKYLPQQLMNHKCIFKFSKLDKSARFKHYIESIDFIDKSMMCNIVTNVSKPDVFLELYSDISKFKLFMGDTGLLITELINDVDDVGKDVYDSLIFQKSSSNLGMIFENVVAQMLILKGYKLHYHNFSYFDKETNKNKKYEIDFIIAKGNNIIPIEVKSSKRHLEHKSLDVLKVKYNLKCKERYVISEKNFEIKDDTIYLPIYMTSLI